MLAAIYLRKSRTDAENDTVEATLNRHKEILTQYAADSNITIAEVYEEVASGDSLYLRPQMLRLLDELEKYDAILRNKTPANRRGFALSIYRWEMSFRSL